MVIDLDANVVIPGHWHNGWSAVGIIDGTVEIAGVAGTSGSLMVFEPLARRSLKAGPKGSTVVLFFDSGQAAFPHWDVPDDQHALQFNRALRVPAGLP
jgi:hypothetical protein